MRMSPAVLLAPLGAGVAIAAVVLAGPLDPPAGPIAPSFKTLADVEPRTAIQSLTGSDTARYVISRPGAYYLTTDLTGAPGKHGIEIQAGDVTIDLNGYSLVGVQGSLSAIRAPAGAAKPAISIRNGAVSGWGSIAIDLQGHHSARIENVRAHNNGAHAFVVGGSGVITSCQAHTNTGCGFVTDDRAVITECTATGNGVDGFRLGFECVLNHLTASVNGQHGLFTSASAVITECTASANGQNGIRLGDNSTISRSTANANIAEGIHGMNAVSVERCTASHNSSSGIALMGAGNAVTDCVVRGNGRDGVRVFNTSVVTGCVADANATIPGNFHAGIRLIGQGNRADSNSLSANSVGLRIDSPGSLATRNNFSFNPVRVDAEPGNNVAQIIVVPGANFVSTDPWANFAH